MTASSNLLWDYYHDSYEIYDVIQDNEGELWGVLNTKFMKMNTTTVTWSKETGEQFKRIFYLNDGTIVAGTTTGLLFLNENTQSFTRKKPNGLLMNNVSAVHVMTDGRLVAGSRYGLMIKEGAGWRNIVGCDGDDLIISNNKDYARFVADTIPVHFGNYIADIEEGLDGLLYCGVRGTYPEPQFHGGGIVIIDVDDPANFTLIDTAQLDYFADEYLIVKDIAKDPFGNLWIADTYATTHFEPLKVLKTDGTWGAYDVTSSGGILSLTPNSIDFDSWGRVWIGSFEDNNNVGGASNGGLAMLDYSGDPADPDETEWTKVNVNTAVSTNTVWSLGVNSSDVLYLLSPKGLNGLTLKFSNSDPVSHYGFTYYPNISFSSGSKLRIDPRDNIWTTSPTQGVYVLTSSASYWPDINGLTAENSYLLSNNVAAVAFDENEGLAYIATDRGINVVKIPYAKKNSAYSNVDIFPSPFRIPTATPLTIDGLMDGSSCKIMTLTGRVLQTIESRPDVEGYQAFWDGRDESGHWVGTGVYLISMYDENGASSFSKIAVIHH
jgi:ligand-binding sensor domain-containing protein